MSRDRIQALVIDTLASRQQQRILPRLAKVLDVIIENDWWFDRDALRAKIPA